MAFQPNISKTVFGSHKILNKMLKKENMEEKYYDKNGGK